MRQKNLQKQWIMLALISIFITVCMVIYSKQAFDAAVAGLKIWWEVVFPALLPFFILCEILMGLGVVNAMGALLEPLMRPLFKVPGVGAFALAMGLASGYPIGAKITGELRRKKLCSRIEGERLVSFCNTADPLFMIGAVAVGMFNNPSIGFTIAGAHYVSSIALGLIMRFYGRKEEKEQGVIENPFPGKRGNIFFRAFDELIKAREKDGRSFGQLLGESITGSVQTLLLIGGFIILFSVITEILMSVGIVNFFTKIIMFLLAPFGIVKSMILPIIGGIFEITNGADLAARAAAPLFQRVAICNAIVAWSGLSVHAQVATMVNGTDIRIKPYVFARLLHGILAALATFIFLSPSVSVWMPVHVPIIFKQCFFTLGFLDRFIFILNNILVILLIMVVSSLIIVLIQRIKIIVYRYKE